MGITLNNEQLYTVMDMESWFRRDKKQLYQISGAAGTGKTTLVLFLIDKLGLELDEVLFVAYMGKAATQLARNGLPAKTIHSAIYDYVTRPVIDPVTHRKVMLANGKVKMKGEFVLKDHLKKKIKLIVVDEGGMVPENIALDLMSFNLPIIVLGDLNQLPPVFGKSYFLEEPDSVLTQIMRQAEGDPIVWLAQKVLANDPLKPGVWGKSAVIAHKDLEDFTLQHANIVLTERNKTRNEVNHLFRHVYRNYKNPDRPYVGEKVICRKNNWDLCIGDGIYLTNGLTGIIEEVNMASYNGKTIKLSIMPDFVNKTFNSVPVSYRHLFGLDENLSESEMVGERYLDKLEFAYAITVHSSQGSQYKNVVFLEDEPGIWNDDMQKRIMYTAITRAIESITYVLA